MDFFASLFLSSDKAFLTEAYDGLLRTVYETFPDFEWPPGVQTYLSSLSRSYNRPAMMYMMMLGLVHVPAFRDYCLTHSHERLSIFHPMLTHELAVFVSGANPSKYPTHTDFLARMYYTYLNGWDQFGAVKRTTKRSLESRATVTQADSLMLSPESK